MIRRPQLSAAPRLMYGSGERRHSDRKAGGEGRVMCVRVCVYSSVSFFARVYA